jgi:saccharopine dehydrogenase-like NADP-dependent oxidoreductase
MGQFILDLGFKDEYNHTMKILILGAGMQGRIAAWDLKRSGHDVTVIDREPENLVRCRERVSVKTFIFDIRDEKRLVRLMKDFDAVLGALPAVFGFYALRCAVKAGVDMADMSYLPEDPLRLGPQARARKVRIIPDAGFAPGLSNILCGEAYRILGRADRLRILVGGMPQKPRPPFNYRITWSPADLMAEYLRPARIFKNYRVLTRPALDGIEEIRVPGVGRLECFYTDGLRTLLRTFRSVRDMEEKTVRYPGHARLFKTIIDAGFFSEKTIPFRGGLVTPKEFALEFLKNFLGPGDERDLSVLIVELTNKQRAKKYLCVDRYDPKERITSMARMTAFSGSVIVQGIKKYPGRGVIPPEYLGRDKGFSDFVKKELKKRGIIIKESG